ncbi:MAG: hypothetical protein PHC88_11875 [Terrimicrobiaceae bacterium]|nr:hypothetical protein [Terrimicrobiaceae bacterium]
MKRAAAAIGLLLLFGAARLPYEIHLTRLQRAAGFRTASLDLPLREKVGQMGFVAALSGFRSLVAAVLWIEANNAWQNVEWGRMAGLFQTVTTLQPKSILYWDMSAWHMAWNASIAAFEDKSQPSEVLRRRAERQYWEVGKKFYEDGLRSNPDSANLWEKLAILERDKFDDHSSAATAFATAAGKPGARPYLRRMTAYEVAQIPGREREAYDTLKALYDEGPGQRVPRVITLLKELEEKLGIPADQRIKEGH